MKRTSTRSTSRKRQTKTTRGRTSPRKAPARKTKAKRAPAARAARATTSARKTLTRRAQSMPAFVKRALTERGLMAAYRQRPPYQRNDYLGWLASAQQDATKQKRLNQMLRELAGGTKYMNMAWQPRAARG